MLLGCAWIGCAVMLSPPRRRPLGPMLFAVLGQGLSTGMGFAALGLALYAPGPAQAAAALFAAIGAACGVAAAILRLWLDGVPAALPVPLPADSLAALLRTTLAQAQRQRQASRIGSVADRLPALPAEPVAGLASTPARQPALAKARALSADTAVRLVGSAVEA